MKEKLEKIRQEYSLVLMNKEDMVTAIEFVRDLLELELEHDREAFPTATISHKEHRIAIGVIGYLEDFINEHTRNDL